MTPKMMLDNRTDQVFEIMDEVICDDWDVGKCVVVVFDVSRFHIENITRARARLHSNGWSTQVMWYLNGELIAVFITEDEYIIKCRLK